MYLRMSVVYDPTLLENLSTEKPKVEQVLDGNSRKVIKYTREDEYNIKLPSETEDSKIPVIKQRKDTPRTTDIPYTQQHRRRKLRKHNSTSTYNNTKNNISSQLEKNITTDFPVRKQSLLKQRNDHKNTKEQTDDVKSVKNRFNMGHEGHEELQEKQIKRKNRIRISKNLSEKSGENRRPRSAEVRNGNTQSFRKQARQKQKQNQPPTSLFTFNQPEVLLRSASEEVVYRANHFRKTVPSLWRQSDSNVDNKVPSNVGEYYNSYNIPETSRRKGRIKSFFTQIADSFENLIKFKKTDKAKYKSAVIIEKYKPNLERPKLPDNPPNAGSYSQATSYKVESIKRPNIQIDTSEYHKERVRHEVSHLKRQNLENQEVVVPKLNLSARSDKSDFVYMHVDQHNEKDDTIDVQNSIDGKSLPESQLSLKSSPSLRRVALLKEAAHNIPTPPSGRPLRSGLRCKRLSRASSYKEITNKKSFSIKTPDEHCKNSNEMFTSYYDNACNEEKKKRKVTVSDLMNESSSLAASAGKNEKNNESDLIRNIEHFVTPSADSGLGENLSQDGASPILSKPRMRTSEIREVSASSSESIYSSEDILPQKCCSTEDLRRREATMREAQSFEKIIKHLDSLAIEIDRGQKQLKRRMSDSRVILGRKRRVLKSRQVPVVARRVSRSPSREKQNFSQEDDINTKQKSISLGNLRQLEQNNLKRRDSWASNVSLRLNSLIDNKSSNENVCSNSLPDEGLGFIKKTTYKNRKRHCQKRPPKLKQPLIIDTPNKVKSGGRKNGSIYSIELEPRYDCSFDDLQKDFEDFANKIRKRKK